MPVCLPFVSQYASHFYCNTPRKIMVVGVTGMFPPPKRPFSKETLSYFQCGRHRIEHNAEILKASKLSESSPPLKSQMFKWILYVMGQGGVGFRIRCLLKRSRESPHDSYDKETHCKVGECVGNFRSTPDQESLKSP